MKKITYFFLFCFFSMLSLNAKDELVFTSIKNSSFEPYGVKVMNKVYSQLGYKIKLEPLPAKRSLQYANSGGRYDGELFRISGIEQRYPNLIPIKVSLNESRWMVYSKNPYIKVNGWESLRDYKIGIRRGIQTTANGTLGMDRQIVDTNEQLFALLDKGRVDVVIMSIGNGKKTLKKTASKDIYQLEPPVQIIPVYHFVHKQNDFLVPKITKIMKGLEKEGYITKTRKEILGY